ncbi:MAG TPA: glycosyltransferase family 2 protein, partial [Firmicutes bacterium]|nr:glycosyltransferase family 2 protein [Bacillota bacterium]
IRFEKNIGYAGAIAKAWTLYDEEFLVIANNDIEFTPGWLESLISCAEREDAHAVSAVIRHENETEIDTNTNSSLNPLLFLIPGIFTDRTKAVYPSGACFLLKREPAIQSMKIVDPDYFLYYEDVYIGFLLRSLGLKVVQCPDSIVNHSFKHSVSRENRSKIAFLQERNRLITQILFFDIFTLIKISPIIFLDSLFKIPSCWIRKKPVWGTIKAHFIVVFSLGSILRKRAKLRRLSGFKPRKILPYLTGKVFPHSFPAAPFWNFLSTGWFRLMGIPVDREARK